MAGVRRVGIDKFTATMCRDSYYQFFLEFWSLTAAEKLRDAWYIRQTCEKLQEICERVFRGEPKIGDFIDNCPPGTTKSSMFSVLLQPWCWTRMPSCRFITGSHSERLSLDLSRKSRDVVMSPKYKRLFPEIKLREDQNTKGFWLNAQGGFRYACGVGGSVIGQHAHIIVIDDPVDPQGVLSDLTLADANLWQNEVLSRRKVDISVTPTLLVMQRLHQNDPTQNMLDRNTNVEQWVLPCDLSWEVKPERFRAYYTEDGLLDDVRLPREALEEAEKELGEAGYAGQYGQNPVPRGGAKFKVEMFQKASVGMTPKQWLRSPVRYWDKAATQGGGAFTVGVKGAMDLEGKIWVLDVERFQKDSGRREVRIDEVAVADGRKVRIRVEQEPGAGGKESAETTCLRLAGKGYSCTMDKVSGDKELRADPFSVFVNQGKVVLVEAPWNKAFIEEHRYFPRSKYKDQVDAGSGMFNSLVKKRTKIGAFR